MPKDRTTAVQAQILHQDVEALTHALGDADRKIHLALLYIIITPAAFLLFYFIHTSNDCISSANATGGFVQIQFCMNSAAAATLGWIRWIAAWILEVDMFYVQSVATCGALSWLLYRAWLTLWKPVPELISILGVEVPDPPNVSLAGIKADAITIHWLRPEASRPVQKYLIQVNGVNVGETQKQETAITVTGLKPAHFYNVRVIAVGSNNFQAGSAVIRLRTYGRDGRPILENGRLPSNFAFDEAQAGALEESSDESTAGRGHTASIEAAPLPDSSVPSIKRETSGGVGGQRRNTVGRKHSPSSAAADQAAYAARKSTGPEESMLQLTEKFESIRRETEEIIAQVGKDVEDYKVQLLDLTAEKEEKRLALKEKEEANEKLKKDLSSAENKNRTAQTRQRTKEKQLKEKEAAKAKMIEDMGRWKKEIDAMKAERSSWQKEREELDAQKSRRKEELHSTIRQRQNSLNGLEEEIKARGLQIKQLEEERKKLPGLDNDEEAQRDAIQAQKDQDWEQREKELHQKLNAQIHALRTLEAEYQHSQTIYNTINVRHANNALMFHGNSSGVDFDPTANQGKVKSRRSRNRKSRTNTVSSPSTGFPISEPAFPSASTYHSVHNTTSPTFVPGPYFDLSNDTAMVPLSEQMGGMSEADVRALTAGAPLSPSATSLLPSNIFADDDPPNLPGAGGVFGPALYGAPPVSAYDNDPQSPSSSSRSASLMSSPRSSAHNLAMYGVSGREYGVENDRRSLNSLRADFGVIGSPSVPEQSASSKSFGSISNMFSFPRPRGKTLQDGPALGTLKQGQSQSFPRSTEEPESAHRSRRISFSANWNMTNFLSRGSPAGEASEGNGPAPLRNIGAQKRRGFNLFNKSMDDPSMTERNPSSPRPLSIASSDLPRPSTDSAPFGWPAAEGIFNRNSPLNTNWSVNAPQTWSRNASRRPSLQHGSSTALTSGIASDDDDFLPPDTLTSQSGQPAAGVIGTRPQSSQRQITPRLNPTAPAFERTTPHGTPSLQHSTPVTERTTPGLKGMFNFGKSDKDKSRGKGKEKASSESPNAEDSRPNTSPSVSRMSRDAHSIRTQTSISESHESLSLERTSSNTPSEQATPSGSSVKESSSFRQLFRKGSSSKFGISSIQKNASLFGSKKPSSSTMNSERDSLDEYGEEAGLGRSVDSVTSSPMIGSVTSGDVITKSNSVKDGARSTPKESRMSGVNWSRFGIKKGRESTEVDRERGEAEGLGLGTGSTIGSGDEGKN